jgi:DNA polymerase (family X)
LGRNKELSEMFNEIALMLSIEPEKYSRFEVRAYQNVSMALDSMAEDVGDIYAKGGIKALMELPAIGKGIAHSIEEFIKTGKMQKYEKLKRIYPIDFKNLIKIEGLGPKKIAILYQKRGMKNVDDLRKLVSEKKIRGLEGFGERSEEILEKGLQTLESNKGRILLGEALPVADAIIKEITESGLAETVEIAGSAKRMKETVGDLDILAISSKGPEIMKLFSGLSEVERTIASGPTKSTVWLKIGISCDLRVIDAKEKNFGAALQYFTGSKEHNVAVRTIAVSKGYKLNEYGLFDKKNKAFPCSDEKQLYGHLGLQYVPPEMRENRGEIALAKENKIPRLIERSDLRGDLHTHTKETDGVNTIEEMAEAAMKLGFEYFATTNHTKSLGIARGMNEKQFAEYFKRVDKLNDKLEGKIRILKGAEVDILKDGSLDLNRKSLESMDCVVGSVHSAFKMPEKEMTKRVRTAMESGLINILGHPTGRLIGKREGFQIDLDEIFDSAAKNKVVMEIDSYPDRLDLNDSNILRASKHNLLFSVDSDAHNVEHFAVLRYGIGTARRGWLTKERVINTLKLADLMKVLGK